MTAPPDLSVHFPRYELFHPAIPVYCITPDLDGCFHRFFDTSPVSPSGRYVGLTRLNDETRPPVPGESADIVIVDLAEGTHRVVARSRAFGTQLGAQVQWGKSDQDLYYNDMDTREWRPHAVRLDLETGEKRSLDGPVYMVSPNGALLASPCLMRTNLTQGGYGVTAPEPWLPLNNGASAADGLYVTDADTGRTRLLVSYEAIVEALGDEFRCPPYTGGAFYGFHVKWNPQGTRLMFAVRYRPHAGGGHARMPCDVLTFNADGSNIRLALPARLRARGGHHPNWCPDGEHITQNLVIGEAGMRFVRYRYDGTGLEPFHPVRAAGTPRSTRTDATS